MSEKKKVNWKNTLNLPKTSFPMKARLNQREPQLLKKWQEMNIYQAILEKRKNRPIHILHDAPPMCPAGSLWRLGQCLPRTLSPVFPCRSIATEMNIDDSL
jgi:isoleucyl-tRNA synthetase